MTVLSIDRQSNCLVVTPILSPKQIGDASIDVRLGNQFIVFRAHRFGIFDPFGKSDRDPRKIQERQVMRFGERFVLHPGVLILGCTFEYISMPNNLECQVEGRSSWARLGLQIATANSIEPGFKGVATLELSNVGTVPLTLMPGIRIAQLVFRDADPPIPNPYCGMRKYRCPVGPEFSRLDEDYDWKSFGGESNYSA
ncbi:MAG: dCTP deaminase [bacterium]|nr:dCTP deaminase [bacterium]